MQLNLTSGTYTLRFSSRQPTPGGLSTQLDNVSLPSPANNVPVAADQSVTTDQDTPKDITLSATDTDGDPLTFQIVTPPANGTVTGTPPDVTYTPNSSYTGLDTFTFKANDGQDDSNVATVVVDVRNLCQPGTVFHNVLLPEVVLDIPSFKNPPVQLRFAPLGLEFTVRTASEADALCEALSNVGTLTMGVRRMSTGGSFLDRFI